MYVVNARYNTEMFVIALQDIHVAEECRYISPNISVYHSCQAVEKTLKGLLRCYGLTSIDIDNTHELDDLLSSVERFWMMPESVANDIDALNGYKQNLRYKIQKTDPTPGDADVVMNKAKCVMDAVSNHGKCALEYQEASDEYKKYLKSVKPGVADES